VGDCVWGGQAAVGSGAAQGQGHAQQQDRGQDARGDRGNLARHTRPTLGRLPCVLMVSCVGACGAWQPTLDFDAQSARPHPAHKYFVFEYDATKVSGPAPDADVARRGKITLTCCGGGGQGDIRIMGKIFKGKQKFWSLVIYDTQGEATKGTNPPPRSGPDLPALPSLRHHAISPTSPPRWTAETDCQALGRGLVGR
jgi:hypothetical protein